MPNYKTHFNQFTAPKLTEFIKANVPETKGLYKMKKEDKVNIMNNFLNEQKFITVNDFIYVKPERMGREYGITQGRVKPYSKEEQLSLNEYYDESHPLMSKPLDPRKHKTQYTRNLKINLQDHQKKFILSFINDFLQGALLFHSVGSGKTLTAVAFSHYYLLLHPENNVCIISPPSLLFNFVEALKEYGLDIRDNRYKFETYEKFCRSPDNYVNDKTLLIIDEAHYFRTYITEGKGEYKDMKTGKVKIDRGKNKNGRIIIDACKKCHKLIAMSGTPFINRLYDIENIMSMIGKKKPMTPAAFDLLLKNTDNIKDYFDYRISYFNVLDTEAKRFFPKVIYKYVDVELKDEKYKKIYNDVSIGSANFKLDDTKYDKMIFELIRHKKNKNSSDDESPDNEPPDDDDEDIIDNAPRRSKESMTAYYNTSRQLSNFIIYEKIKYIVNLIKEHKNENVIVYSVFMMSCLYLIKNELSREDIKYVAIDGDINTRTRQQNLEKFNNPDSGINVLLISKAGTEGVSTRRTRHIVICESAFNMALTEQAVARAVRFKSHEELPEKQRDVTVHRLMLTTSDDDHDIIKNLNNGLYDARFMEYQTVAMDREKYATRMTKRATKIFTGKDDIELLLNRYMAEDKKRQAEEHKASRTMFREKKPFVHKISLLLTRLPEYILKDADRKRLDNDAIFFKNFKKYEELSKKIDAKYGDEQKLSYRSYSSDIKLEFMSLNKQTTIRAFVEKLFRNNFVSRVEDHTDDTTKKLINSLESGKPVKEILKEQRDILIKRKNEFLKLSRRIDNFVTSIGYEEMSEKINEEKHREKRKEGPAGLQEYHTPSDVADRLIGYSEKIKIKQPNMRILEPTAGYGALVSAIVRKKGNVFDYVIEMVELNDVSREALRKLIDKFENVLHLEDTKNFLEYKSNEAYDLVVMNPPFHLQKRDTKYEKDYWDADFVIRACGMLKDGGELLCIVSPGFLKNMKNLKININNNVFKIDDQKYKIQELEKVSVKDKKVKGKNWKAGDEGGKGGNKNISYNIYRIEKLLPPQETKQNIIIKKKDDTETELPYNKSRDYYYHLLAQNRMARRNNYLTD